LKADIRAVQCHPQPGHHPHHHGLLVAIKGSEPHYRRVEVGAQIRTVSKTGSSANERKQAPNGLD